MSSSPSLSANPFREKLLLTINAGSSSLKAGVFAADEKLERRFTAKAEWIGQGGDELRIQHHAGSRTESLPIDARDHNAAGDALARWLEKTHGSALAAVAHRVVHGGPDYGAPVQVTEEVLGDLRKLSPFDPDHMPAELALIDAYRNRFPSVPHVACFDTAFHRELPRVARLFPIPRKFEAKGVRRYGFHGLSYAFLVEEIGRIAGAVAAQGRLVLAHLGSGASLAAVREGRSIDTTMGFTPAGGIPMSTRSGDLDPGLGWYLASRENISPEVFNGMVNHESGLLGISETSADIRDLLAHEATDPRAAEAVAFFCYQVRKAIGALAAALGGIDTLVFSGGIGENSAEIRARICAGLNFLGIKITAERNAAHAGVISPTGERITVRVIRTNEELMMAREVQRLLFGAKRETTGPKIK
jgi:acetate kinase